jgi:excisionase family DNA binding protein
MDSLLSQKQAARVLGLSVRTLERYRVAGTGPRWARLGKLVRYRNSDLTEWVESNLRHSTSEMANHERQPATTRS